MPAAEKRFVLLDRDGVINRQILGGYVTCWEEFEFLPGVLDALRLLANHGYTAIVTSNQACVGKGLLSMANLENITARFLAIVEEAGGRIDGVYYCAHRMEENCECRKPRPGLLLQAQRDHGFQFAETYVIGDSAGDLEAARRVGAPSILVSQAAEPLHGPRIISAPVVHGLFEAAEFILGPDPAGAVISVPRNYVYRGCR